MLRFYMYVSIPNGQGVYALCFSAEECSCSCGHADSASSVKCKSSRWANTASRTAHDLNDLSMGGVVALEDFDGVDDILAVRYCEQALSFHITKYGSATVTTQFVYCGHNIFSFFQLWLNMSLFIHCAQVPKRCVAVNCTKTVIKMAIVV